MNATPAISDALISDRTVPAGPNYRVFSDAVFRAAIANALRLKDERIQVSDGGRVVAEYFYFTRGGQPFRPSYLYDAAQVETKEAGSSASRNAHWIRRCQAFAGHLRDGGIRTINLDPSFSDVRPFLWQGFLASPVYSICLTRESQLESSAKKEIKKALKKLPSVN